MCFNMSKKYYFDHSSQDCKILTWNKENYQELLKAFTEEELERMQGYLSQHPYHPIDYEYYTDFEEDRYTLVYDYICHWLYDIMMNGVVLDYVTAQNLLETAIAMG